MNKEIEVEVEPASGRKDLRWKYARLLNENIQVRSFVLFVIKQLEETFINKSNTLLEDLEIQKSVQDVLNILGNK